MKNKPRKGFENYALVDMKDTVTFGTTLFMRNDRKALKVVFPAGQMVTFAPMDEINEGKMNEIICGDSLEVLKTLADESVDCVITSPPYWGLRDYGVDGQLGLEPHFNEYIDKLIAIFDEVKRVL